MSDPSFSGDSPAPSEMSTTAQHSLGEVQLFNHVTDEVILIPKPSRDVNDPLNWPQWYKWSIAALICAAMAMCNFLAAGPSIAIVDITLDFFPDANPVVNPTGFLAAIAQVAYCFTAVACVQGAGNLVWVPLANKYGRRPVYIVSFVLYLACTIWLIFEKSYPSFLAGRILMGFGSGAAETIAPITITDIFFLHERGTIMAMYSCFLSVGVAGGLVISGLITINHHWRTIFEVSAALIGLILLAAIFGFPETAYRRVEDRSVDQPQILSGEKTTGSNEEKGMKKETSNEVTSSTESSGAFSGERQSYIRSLRVFSGVHTDESLLRMFIRPIGLILLPPVLWAALVQAVTIGFLVAVSSNVGVAFSETYGFEAHQVGLCFIAAIIGSLAGIFAGGQFCDFVADHLTRRNGGLREPEMRLPAMAPCLISAPLALILYGVGIEYKLHWICPTVGLGLLNFSIAQGTNVCLVYVIDAYRPIAGEVTLTVMGFKSLFGFLLSFYTNIWVEESGYLGAFGAMAGISAGVILLSVPLYYYGKRIRHTTWGWSVVSYMHWADDRDVGE